MLTYADVCYTGMGSSYGMSNAMLPREGTAMSAYVSTAMPPEHAIPYPPSGGNSTQAASRMLTYADVC
jgi:hypothetical protein